MIHRLIRLFALAAAVAAPLAAATDASAQSTPWRYDDTREGGVAQTCKALPARAVCFVVFCGPSGDIRFGVNGLREVVDRPRAGRVRIDAFSRDVVFTLERAGRGAEIWELRIGDDAGALAALKRGARLDIAVVPRRTPLAFSLSGSNAALSRLERRCA